mgnify:CR=1 FL=1
MKSINIEKINDSSRFDLADRLNDEVIDNAIQVAVKKVKHNIVKVGELYPSACTTNGNYEVIKNNDWTNGFWTGMLWLSYENTGETIFKNLALKNVESFKYRLDHDIVTNTHDLGFLYSLSCVAAYKLTGSEMAKETALAAAKKLATRYNQKGKFIQAWGNKGASDNYRLIVDALMNIPLLQWASEVTGDQEYSKIANQHFLTTLKYAIREDGSAYHTYFFDNETGVPLGGKTRQGYADNSSWARGQAWLVYGIALNYRYLKSDNILKYFEGVTNYFLNRLPQDLIPYWDLIFTDNACQSRDSSSAVIAICGINQMMQEANELNFNYEKPEAAMLYNLITKYSEQETNYVIPLINHSVYSWHDGLGIDEGSIWGDYFYLEALTRFKKKWNPYW